MKLTIEIVDYSGNGKFHVISNITNVFIGEETPEKINAILALDKEVKELAIKLNGKLKLK